MVAENIRNVHCINLAQLRCIITISTMVVPAQVQAVHAGQQLVIAQQPVGTVVHPRCNNQAL